MPNAFMRRLCPRSFNSNSKKSPCWYDPFNNSVCVFRIFRNRFISYFWTELFHILPADAFLNASTNTFASDNFSKLFMLVYRLQRRQTYLVASIYIFALRRDISPFPVIRVGICLHIARLHEIGRTTLALDALLLLALPLLLTLQKLEPLLIDDNQALLRDMENAP